MKVRELMTRDVAVVGPDASGGDAARLMWDRDCGIIPVINPLSKQLLGVVTDRDLCMASFLQGRALHDIPVSTVMSREVVSVNGQQEATAAHELMRRHQYRRLVVVDAEGRLEGVLSINDLARRALKSRGEAGQEDRLEVASTVGSVSQPHSMKLTPDARLSRKVART